MRALARANRLRLARAELKRAIARGDQDAAEVVLNCPWEAESMTLAELLTSQRRWGRTRARKFLVPLALDENKQLGTLSSRQRQVLTEGLAEAANVSAHSTQLLQTEPDGKEGLWDELSAVARRSREITSELSLLNERRDELIRSLSTAGASRRAVAEAASLTVGRVQQIVNESQED